MRTKLISRVWERQWRSYRAQLGCGILQKALELSHADRSIASAQDNYENDLLEAVKYDSTNMEVLIKLSQMYMDNFRSQKSKDKILLQKSKQYLLRAVQVNPKYPLIDFLMTQLKDLENQVS